MGQMDVLSRGEVKRKKGDMQKFGEAINAGMNAYQKNQQTEAENNAIKKLTGMDPSGIQDPKMRQEILAQALQGQQKQGLMQNKQSFLNNLFQGNQNKSNIGNQLISEGNQSSPSQEVSNQGFDPSQLTDEQIAQATAIDPNMGRALAQAKDVALREKRAEKEFEERQRIRSPEYEREKQLTSAQAAADVKYNQELQAAHKQHEIKTKTLDRLEQLNKKGVTGKPYEKILEKMGLINLTSDGRREFAADVKNLITDIRSILGGQFSTFEFQTILNAYPSADFSKEANDSILKNLKDFQDIRNQEFKIANDIKKENKGKLPEDFQSQVNERLQEYAQSKMPEIKENARKIMNEEYGIEPGKVLMFDPNGEPLSVSLQDVERYQSLGAVLP